MITNAHIEGQALIVGGSDFGQPPEILIADALSNGQAGAVIGSPWGNYSAGPNVPIYSDGGAHPSQTITSQHHFESGDYNTSLELRQSVNDIYFSFEWKYSRVPNTTWTRNCKPFIFYGETRGHLCYIGFEGQNGELRNSAQMVSPGNVTLWSSNFGPAPTLGKLDGQWVRFENWLKQNSPDQSDGTWETVIHDGSIRRTMYSDSYSLTHDGRPWVQLHFGSYNTDDNAPDVEADIYMANIYAARSRQRIEIGNAPTYGACTARAIQPHTSWLDGEIRCAFSAGLVSGDLYVYQINELGLPVNENGLAIGETIPAPEPVPVPDPIPDPEPTPEPVPEPVPEPTPAVMYPVYTDTGYDVVTVNGLEVSRHRELKEAYESANRQIMSNPTANVVIVPAIIRVTLSEA